MKARKGEVVAVGVEVELFFERQPHARGIGQDLVAPVGGLASKQAFIPKVTFRHGLDGYDGVGFYHAESPFSGRVQPLFACEGKSMSFSKTQPGGRGEKVVSGGT